MSDLRFTVPSPDDNRTPQVGDQVMYLDDDGVIQLYVVEAEPTCEGQVRLRLGTAPPSLPHEHEWVDTTVLENDQRVEICAAGGCSATRTVPR